MFQCKRLLKLYITNIIPCVLCRTVARTDCGSIFVSRVCLLSATKEVLVEANDRRVVEQLQDGIWMQVRIG